VYFYRVGSWFCIIHINICKETIMFSDASIDNICATVIAVAIMYFLYKILKQGR